MYSVVMRVDGACKGNGMPGAVGGWGAILECPGIHLRKELSGTIPPPTTNQQAEIMAAIGGLEALKRPCEVTLYTDSQYVVGTMTQGWKKRCNNDLWNRLDAVSKLHQVTWIHMSEEGRAHELAETAAGMR